jgi:hypothetical protein
MRRYNRHAKKDHCGGKVIYIPTPTEVDSVSDWIELNILLRCQAMSKCEVASDVEQAMGSEPPEAFVDDIWEELRDRSSKMVASYFTVFDRSVELVQPMPKRYDYLACLLLSLYGVPTPQLGITKIFERVTCLATKRYLSGEALVIGWPLRKGNGNTSLQDGVRRLAEGIGEKFAEQPRSSYKDRGVDVVAWKAFDDARSGQVVLLLQCAAGKNWREKKPVPCDAWNHYIHWACNPQRGFAVPCVVKRHEWHDISRDNGIILDRIRLYNLLKDGIKDAQLSKEIAKWVRTQLKELRN